MIGAPAAGRVGVLAFVPDHWDDYWQTRHHVMSRLARFYRVLWLDAPAGRRQRHSTWWGPGVEGATGAGPLTVYRSETWLDSHRRPRWIADLSRARRTREACTVLRDQGCDRIVLYLWRDEFGDALDHVRPT